MAEGFLRYFANGRAEVYSAGIETHGVIQERLQLCWKMELIFLIIPQSLTLMPLMTTPGLTDKPLYKIEEISSLF